MPYDEDLKKKLDAPTPEELQKGQQVRASAANKPGITAQDVQRTVASAGSAQPVPRIAGSPYRDPREAIPKPQVSNSRALSTQVRGINAPTFDIEKSPPVTRAGVVRGIGGALGVAGPALVNYGIYTDPRLSESTKVKQGLVDLATGTGGVVGGAAAAGLTAPAGPIVQGLAGIGGYATGAQFADRAITQGRRLVNAGIEAFGGQKNYFEPLSHEIQGQRVGAGRSVGIGGPTAAELRAAAPTLQTVYTPQTPPAATIPAAAPRAAVPRSVQVVRPSIDQPTARVPRVAAPVQAPVQAPVVGSYEPPPTPTIDTTPRQLDLTPLSPQEQARQYAASQYGVTGNPAEGVPSGVRVITNDQLFGPEFTHGGFTVPNTPPHVVQAIGSGAGSVAADPGSGLVVTYPGQRYSAAANAAVPAELGENNAVPYMTARQQAGIDAVNPLAAESRYRTGEQAAKDAAELQRTQVQTQGRITEANIAVQPQLGRLGLDKQIYKDTGAKSGTKITLPQNITRDEFGNFVTSGGGEAYRLPDGRFVVPSIGGGMEVVTPTERKSQSKPSLAEAHNEARAALKKGANKDAINRRLLELGYPTLGD